jgi:hypothetical protein
VAHSVYYPAICLDGVMENKKVFMVSGITAEIQSGYPGVFHRHCSDATFYSHFCYDSVITFIIYHAVWWECDQKTVHSTFVAFSVSLSSVL